jgi:hypothetical protein
VLGVTFQFFAVPKVVILSVIMLSVVAQSHTLFNDTNHKNTWGLGLLVNCDIQQNLYVIPLTNFFIVMLSLAMLSAVEQIYCLSLVWLYPGKTY